ncbi:MAG: hypothetical protein K5931_09790 [Lachnospiraceae bacterium]|nr:hypothetical protein [Lachnospiraceae bacterium]
MDDHIYACFKRCVDRYVAEPEFRQLLLEAPAKAIKMLNYEDMLIAYKVKEAVCYIIHGQKPEGSLNAGLEGSDINTENEYLKEYIKRYKLLEGFVRNSVAESRYKDMSLCYFGEIVRNRCQMESADVRDHKLIYYFPIAFELTKGCSVQCDFCGFSADRLSGVFLYNEENAALWRDILIKTRELIGPVAGVCPCYFATEPFDNPDYESFIAVYDEVFGEKPQTTTAVCERDPERFRRFINNADPRNLRERASVRISIRTLEHFKKVMEIFSEDELADIELLSNHRESINRISSSGRSRRNPEIAEKRRLRYSISCIAGLYVNMFSKTVSFMEPEMPDDEYNLGYRIRETMEFTDADDFEECVKKLIGSYSLYDPPKDYELSWNKNIHIDCGDDKYISFVGEGMRYKLSKGVVMLDMIRFINEGYSFSRIASKLGLFGSLYGSAYQRLRELYRKGYVRLR